MKYATAVGYYFFESMKNAFSVMYVAEKIFRNFVGENFLTKFKCCSYLETNPNETWFDQTACFIPSFFQDLQIEVLSEIFAHNLLSAITAEKTSFRIYGLEKKLITNN